MQQLHPAAIDMGLQRVRPVASVLGLNELNADIITIAGTNGKGSTVAALHALLTAKSESFVASPRRIGVYTSPHLQRFNERIVIDNSVASDDQICEALAAVDQARQCCFLGENQIPSLTYFEFTTLAALWLFKRAGLDCILLEVGLGGRLDAVNIVDPSIAVVCSIGLDHQQWLGDTRDAVAAEKAGILRPGIPVVLGDTDPPNSLREKVAELNCTGLWLSELSAANHPDARDFTHGFVTQTGQLNWFGYMPAPNNCPIRLERLPQQVQLHLYSWSCALQAATLLNALPDIAVIRDVMRQTALVGRQSTHYYYGREFLLDVAHNEDSVRHLSHHLLTEKSSRPTHAGRTIAIFACMADKAVDAMLGLMLSLVDDWVFPDLIGEPRSFSGNELYERWAKQSAGSNYVVSEQSAAIVAHNVAEAINWAIHHSVAKDKIVVFGSFVSVGAALDVFSSPE